MNLGFKYVSLGISMSLSACSFAFAKGLDSLSPEEIAKHENELKVKQEREIKLQNAIMSASRYSANSDRPIDLPEELLVTTLTNLSPRESIH
jgi:hypothetical protein